MQSWYYCYSYHCYEYLGPYTYTYIYIYIYITTIIISEFIAIVTIGMPAEAVIGASRGWVSTGSLHGLLKQGYEEGSRSTATSCQKTSYIGAMVGTEC